MLLLFGKLNADELLNPYMNELEYISFIQEVGDAVSSHPEYLSSLDSLIAVFVKLTSSSSNLPPGKEI